MDSPADLVAPSTPEGSRGFSALARDPAHALVALDFDGTLSAIVPEPTAARPFPGAVPALRRLSERVATVAVITGRPAGDAVELLGLAAAPVPGALTVLGHYGAERWNGATGEIAAPAPVPGVAVARDALPELLAGIEAADPSTAGTTIEDKGRSVAVHTRRSNDPEAALALLDAPLRALAAGCGLIAEPGRFVLELRPPGMDKGAALTALVAERAASSVLYAGDDLGDLPAFRAIDSLRERGIPGVAVCSASAEAAAVAERADLVVDGPAGVVALLDSLAALIDAR